MVNAGRAYGKDHVLFLRGQKLALELYAQRINDPTWTRYGPVVEMGVYAPVAENYASLWRRFKEMLPEIPGKAPGGGPQVKIYEKEGSETVEIFGPNGIHISFFSVYNPNSSRGHGYDILLGTEVAYGKEMTLTESLFKLVFRPNYAGYVMLNSTPRGPNEWWDNAVDDARAQSGFWGSWELHEGTFVDNATTTEADLEEARLDKQKNIYTYRRERLGETQVPRISDEILRNSDGNAPAFALDLVQAALVSLPVDHRGPYYAGTDLAWSGPDDLCTIVVDDPTGLVVDLMFIPKMNDSEIVEHMEMIQSRWRPIRHTFDSNGPLARETQGKLRHLNLEPVETQNAGPNSKQEHVKRTIQHFVQGTIKIPNPETYPGLNSEQRAAYWKLIEQIRAYRRLEIMRELVEKGRIIQKTFVTYSKPPVGTGDDGVDALVMCLLSREVYCKGSGRPTRPHSLRF